MSVVAVARSLIALTTETLEDGNVILSGNLGGVVKSMWTPLLNGNSGSPADLAQFSDRSVQVEGTFGSGGSVSLQGSNDGVTFHTLNDLFGNPLVITSSSLKGVSELTGFVRPVVTAGDGTTSLTVTMYASREG